MHSTAAVALLLIGFLRVLVSGTVVNAGGLPDFKNLPAHAQRQLPDGPLIVAYATTCADGATVLEEARAGVNVIVWFAATLTKSVENTASFSFPLGTKQLACIVNVANKLKAEELPTAHLVSIGGWNAPHPAPGFSGAEYFKAFERFQDWVALEQHKANSTSKAWTFDGVDWDLEGNDAFASANNEFSLETLAVMGNFSQLAKTAGYLVTLVPPQSYFDVSTSHFSRSVRWPPLDPWHQDFHYTGRNVYAYVLAAYGKTSLPVAVPPGAVVDKMAEPMSLTVDVDTFDLISIQLYESWSDAAYFTEAKGMNASEYLASWIARFLKGVSTKAPKHQQLQDGWFVNFTADPTLPGGFASRHVELSVESQLVVGLSFGSSNGKSFFTPPRVVETTWDLLRNRSMHVPRGVMFWNIELDKQPANGTTQRCYMAAGLNSFLKTRSPKRSRITTDNEAVVLV